MCLRVETVFVVALYAKKLEDNLEIKKRRSERDLVY